MLHAKHKPSNNVMTQELHSALAILEEATGLGCSEKEETRSESLPPSHRILVLSGESLADCRSHPNDRTCLMLAVVNCQARTV